MGADNHLTTRPKNRNMNARRESLKNDLMALDCVSSARDDAAARNGVVFKSSGSSTGDIPVDVLRVLVDHNAFLPGRQPDAVRSHSVLIHLE